MWQNKKPDRDGLWLWKWPDEKYWGMGIIKVNKGIVTDMAGRPPRPIALEAWWSIDPTSLTLHVDELHVDEGEE